MDDILSVSDVARVLKVSKGTVTKIFARRAGVVNLGTEGSLKKRRRRLLRIPKAVVEKYVGHPITVPAAKPKRKPKDPLWIMDASQQLAAQVKANADDPKAALETIRFNARVLTNLVPEEQWPEVDFISGDDYEDQ